MSQKLLKAIEAATNVVQDLIDQQDDTDLQVIKNRLAQAEIRWQRYNRHNPQPAVGGGGELDLESESTTLVIDPPAESETESDAAAENPFTSE